LVDFSVLESSEFKQLRKLLGAKVYLVGGAVREGLLGRTVEDIDCASAVHADEALKKLEPHFRVIPTGIEHGTIRVMLPNLGGVELTTFRKPSSRAKSEFSKTIEEDLAGRDFTINAIALDPDSKELIDPFNGAIDIKNKILRAVGDPNERINEDPHRILRALRFGYAEGREIEALLLKCLKELGRSIETVSIERVRDELTKIILCSFPEKAIEALKEIDILDLVLPEFLDSVGFEQNDFHTEDVFSHSLTVLGRARDITDDKIVRIAALFHDIGKPKSFSVGDDGRRHFYGHEVFGAEITESALERLRFGSLEIKRVSRLIKYHMRPIECGPAGVRRLFRDLEDDFSLWRLLKIADKPPIEDEETFLLRLKVFDEMVLKEREKQKEPLRIAVNGDDLKALGISPGPKMGAILKKLEEEVIETPEINEKEKLLERAKVHAK